jgi:hypothetical protein
MQIALGGINHQSVQRLNEQERQKNEITSASANSQPLRTRHVPPPRPRATALADGYLCHNFPPLGWHQVRRVRARLLLMPGRLMPGSAHPSDTTLA